MTKYGFLKQARDGIKKHIEDNKSVLIVWRNEMVDNGSGGQVENPYSEPNDFVITGRISHEFKGLNKPESSSVGLSTDLARYILVDYETEIKENDSFSWYEKNWTIGPVDPLFKYNEVIAYQAPIMEAKNYGSTD